MLFGGQKVQGQNPIPNPNFEIYDTCPSNSGQYASSWSTITTISNPPPSPDYYNICGHMPSVHFLSSTTAQNGAGFNGFIAEGNVSIYNNIKEYLVANLLTPLIAGQTYNISFYLRNNYDGSYWNYDLPLSERGYMGFCFSATHPTHLNCEIPNQTTGGIHGSILNNFGMGRSYIPATHAAYTATTWTPVTLSYTASGGETYVTIGQFKLGPTSLPSGQNFAYYYIDNITVTLPPPSADLSLSVTPTTKTANKGEIITYTYTLTNAGSSTDNVTSKIKVPAGLTLLQATPQQGTYNNNTKIWDVGTMAVGSKTLTLKLKVN